MINWILNIMGISVYFINRFANRTNKAVQASIKYWIKDNWPELSCTLLIDISLMILLMNKETVVNIDNLITEYVPFVMQVAVKPAVSLLIGLILAAGFYALFKTKVNKNMPESIKNDPPVDPPTPPIRP